MDIERINEDTVKFFITSADLENRGFNQEEFCYSHLVGERLFWEMLEELQKEVGIELNGPLFIQVNASEKGLEILMTQAHPEVETHTIDIDLEGKEIETATLNELASRIRRFHQAIRNREKKTVEPPRLLSAEPQVFVFEQFEALIALFKNKVMNFEGHRIFNYNGQYYLIEDFSELDMVDSDLESLVSVIKEYGNSSTVTVPVMEEYGKPIIEERAFATLNQYFS